jgi:hypothetical protein
LGQWTAANTAGAKAKVPAMAAEKTISFFPTLFSPEYASSLFSNPSSFLLIVTPPKLKKCFSRLWMRLERPHPGYVSLCYTSKITHITVGYSFRFTYKK